MHYVYLLKHQQTRRLYYGYTANLTRRVAEHQQNGHWELVYYEAYRAERDARNREQRLKAYGQGLTALKARLRDSLRGSAGCGATRL